MTDKELAYEHVYSDFLIRLCEGEFPLGSSIPSLPNLCTQYNVSKNTILKAMQMLKEDGFIETSPGKVGQVLFNSNNLEQYVKDLPGFVCDKDILMDYYHTVALLFASFYTYASLSCTKEQLTNVLKIVDALKDCCAERRTYISLSIRLSSAFVSPMKNRLLKEIMEIIMRKTMLPGLLLIGHDEIFEELISQAIDTTTLLSASLQRKDHGELKFYWKKLLSIFLIILERAIALGIFPNKPSVCIVNLFQIMDDTKSFIVAKSFRSKILSGEYANGELLPSIEQTKESHQVSMITVRRAYHALCEMGFTKTINGKGTQVVDFYEMQSSDFLEKIALSREECYCDAVEILEISCEDIVRSARNISFSKLRVDINCQWNFGQKNSILVIVYHLFKGCNSSAIFSIHKLLDNCLYWGDYLKGIPAKEELAQANHLKCLEIINLLESGDFETTIEILQELFKTLYPQKL